MQLQVHQEKASEIKSLKDEIADLSTKLGIKLESVTHTIHSCHFRSQDFLPSHRCVPVLD